MRSSPRRYASYASGVVFGVSAGRGGGVAPNVAARLRRDLPRDVVLHGQNIGRAAIVGVAPQRRLVARVDERGVDAQPLTLALHRAAHQHADAELASNRPEVVGAAAIRKGAIGRNHARPLDVSQFPRDRLGNAVGEIRLLSTDHRERQYRHRSRDRASCSRASQAPPRSRRQPMRDGGDNPDDRGHGRDPPPWASVARRTRPPVEASAPRGRCEHRRPRERGRWLRRSGRPDSSRGIARQCARAVRESLDEHW